METQSMEMKEDQPSFFEEWRKINVFGAKPAGFLSVTSRE